MAVSHFLATRDAVRALAGGLYLYGSALDRDRIGGFKQMFVAN